MPAWRRGGGHKVPPLGEMLLVYDCFWERESQLPLMVSHLAQQPHSRVGVAREAGNLEVGRILNTTTIYCMEVWNSQRIETLFKVDGERKRPACST